MRHHRTFMAVSLSAFCLLSSGILSTAAGPITFGPAPVPAVPSRKLEVDLDKATPLPLPSPKFELKATIFRTPDAKEGWVIKIPGGRPIATPAYWEGMVFVGGGYGSHEFYAFDANTGRMIWQYHTGDDGPTAAVVEEGMCVFNTESCTVYVLDAKTGKLVWQQWLGDPLMSQPAVASGRLFIAYPGGGAVHQVLSQEGQHLQNQHSQVANVAQHGASPPGHRLLCADLKTGKHLWDQSISADVISAPIVDGEKVYLTCFDGTSYCFNAKDGSLNWKEAHAGTSAPMVAGGKVIVAQRKNVRQSAYEGLADISGLSTGAKPVAAPSDNDSRIAMLAPAMPAPYLGKGGGSNLSLSQQISLDSGVGFGGGAPAAAQMEKAKNNVGVSTVAGGWAFQGSRAAFGRGAFINAQGADVKATDSLSSKSKWEASFRGKDVRADSQVFSPPALGRRNMYLTSGAGHLVSMDQNNGKVDFMYATKQPMSFQPALAQGNVYVGTSNGLVVCIKTGDKDADGWSGWGGNAQHNKKN